jgi:hypothetical protein
MSGDNVELSKFEGIELPMARYTPLRNALLASVSSLVSLTTIAPGSLGGYESIATINVLRLTALASVNAMMSASGAKCRISAPPEPIEMVNDSSGQLIYRCFHPSSHEWDLQGKRIK